MKGDLKYTPTFLYYLLLNPKKCFDYLLKEKDEEHLGISFAVALFSFTFNLIGKAIASQNKKLILFFQLNIIPYFLGFLIQIILLTAVWYFIFSLLASQQRRGLLLLKYICLSYFPLIFAPSLAIISSFLSSHSFDLFQVLKLTLIIWIVYLQIYAFKITFKLKLFKTFILYILPILGIFIFILTKLWSFFSEMIIYLL